MSISSSKNVARYLFSEISKSEPGSKGIFKISFSFFHFMESDFETRKI